MLRDPTALNGAIAVTNGNGDVIRNTAESNTANVEIIINRAIVTVDKTVDKSFAKVGDVLTYTLKLQNTGNVAVDNVVPTDLLPAGVSDVAGFLSPIQRHIGHQLGANEPHQRRSERNTVLQE